MLDPELKVIAIDLDAECDPDEPRIDGMHKSLLLFMSQHFKNADEMKAFWLDMKRNGGLAELMSGGPETGMDYGPEFEVEDDG